MIKQENTIKQLGKNPITWQTINWKKEIEKVESLQHKIVIATKREDIKEIYRLETKLITSFSGRALAVRKVVTSLGKNTPGIDEVTWSSPKDYDKAILLLGMVTRNPTTYKAQPVKRVMIPKPNGAMRPLGIPTILDRAVQAVYKLAVDPVVETKSDPNSFGFRKNRSTHDAIRQLRSLLDKRVSPTWVLKADIRKCFYKINPKFLLEHTPIVHNSVLIEWLTSGFMVGTTFHDIDEGTPPHAFDQTWVKEGGIIYPLLCNVALNGLESVIKSAAPKKVRGRTSGVHVIRYADDLVIMGRNRETIKDMRKILERFLEDRGLDLSESKTSITNIKEGFDFLGFNIRRMDHRGTMNKSSNQDTVLIIKPSKKAVKSLTAKISYFIQKENPIDMIVKNLNPILRSWAEHKRISYHSQAVFSKIDHYIWSSMMRWTKRHVSLGRRRVVNIYVTTSKTRKWNWGRNTKLLNISEVPIIATIPLKLNRNPYTPEDKYYFEQRKTKLMTAKFRAAIYRKYQNLCPLCNDSLHNGEKVDLHHIIPRTLHLDMSRWRGKDGGKYTLENIKPLHQVCHQQVTYLHNKFIKISENAS